MKHLVSVCLLGLLMAACSQKSGRVEEFTALTEKADGYVRHIEDRQAEIADILDAYNQTVSKDSRFELSFESGYQLSEREQQRLAAHIEQEYDPSCRSILRQVERLNEDIELLAGEIAEMYRQLPEPYKAQGGEDHYALCVRYLQAEHGLTPEQAASVLSGVPLMPVLAEGFDVWCMYEEGSFATYVARGTACISPACFAQRAEDAAFDRGFAHNADSAKNDILPGGGLIGSAATPVSLK